jgi:tetratricopeptide (TPR) repeat protein
MGRVLNATYMLCYLYSNRDKLKEAEEMYQRTLTGYEKALGPDHTLALDTINNLDALYNNQGKLKEAEEVYQRTLTGKKKALGPDNTSTLSIINNLSILYWNQGKLKEAEEMYPWQPTSPIFFLKSLYEGLRLIERGTGI